MSRTLYQRLYDMMVKLRVSEDHPSWHTSRGMVAHIALRLNIHRGRTGPIEVDEETVNWLEESMPKKRRAA